MDEQTERPIDSVIVQIEALPSTARLTDSLGLFRFDGMCQGQVHLLIYHRNTNISD
ncbi:MAG: hypothetical protein R3B47_13850 [Bacteroidia bacterium]